MIAAPDQPRIDEELSAAVLSHLDVQIASARRLLAEIAREHGINRALMRQELAFLDHLVRLIGHEPETGYRPGGNEPAPTYRVVDAQA